MTRKTLFAALLMFAATAQAYMGMLVKSEPIIGGVMCTYQLSNGDLYRVILRDQFYCPPTL